MIQKVTDLNFSQFDVDGQKEQKRNCKPEKPIRTAASNGGLSKREKRQNQLNQDERPQLTSMQLAILVREKLHKECINLANPPFNTKVRNESKYVYANFIILKILTQYFEVQVLSVAFINKICIGILSLIIKVWTIFKQ